MLMATLAMTQAAGIAEFGALRQPVRRTRSALPLLSASLPVCIFVGLIPFAGLSSTARLMAQEKSVDAGSSQTADESAPRPTAQHAGSTVNGRFFPPPLTGRERWRRYLQQTYSTPPIYFVSLGFALGMQALNTPSEWGAGWEGYGKRAGTMYATVVIQNSIYQAGSAALHNEGRYIPCQCRGTLHRAGYALEMTFLTYHNTHKVLDVSQLAGAYGSGMIPVLWYPSRYSPTVQGVQNGHVQMGFVFAVREVQEFAPELKRFFGRFKP